MRQSENLQGRTGGLRRSVGLGVPLFLLLAALSAVPWARAQESAEEPVVRVNEVRVEGNATVSTGAILQAARTRSGAAFSERMLAEDARRILALPQISDVRWETEGAEGMVNVTFIVSETSRIEGLEFAGAKAFDEEELAEQVGFSAGDYLDRYLVRQGARRIEEFYREEGYYFARAQLSEETLEAERRVVYVIVEGPRTRVKKVRFEGNDAFGAWTLKGKVKTKGYFPIFSKGRLNDEQLEQDTIILQQFYRDEGYLDARAFAEVDFNEDRSRAFVTYHIEEGPLYTIDAFTFENVEQLTEETLREAIPSRPGQAYTRDREIRLRRSVERAYGERGYIFATANVEPRYTDEVGEVVVRIRVSEGGRFDLGRVIIQGNDTTKDKVVRRAFDHFGFLPGGTYDTRAMERGRERLLGSGLFQEVEVTPIGQEPEERDALVNVEEARTGMVLFGVGVDTNSGVLGQFAIEQRNFDISKPPGSLKELLLGEAFRGGGQVMRLSFSPGTEVTTGQVKFYEPYLFDQEYYLDTTLMLFRRWRESYLEERRGGNLTLGKRMPGDWSIETTFRLEEVRVSELEDRIIIDRTTDPVTRTRIITAPQDVVDVEGSNFLTSVRLGAGINRTDSLYRPTEGYKLNADWEQYGALGGEFTFAALGAGGTLYKTIYEDITERRTVWATGLRANQIIGDAPVFERYYAGGIGTLRGFEYRGVSPRDGVEDDPIGSDYRVLLNTELIHPIYEDVLFGKLFLDNGLVSEGPVRTTVGFGFELLIPQLFQTVPMHFDFGFPIRKDDKDETQVFSFSFGLQF